MVSVTGADRSGGGAFRNPGDDLPAVVVSARGADVVGQLQLAAVGALREIDPRQAMMGAPHVALRSRDLLLGYCHELRPRLGAAVSPHPLLLQLPQRGERALRPLRR